MCHDTTFHAHSIPVAFNPRLNENSVFEHFFAAGNQNRKLKKNAENGPLPVSMVEISVSNFAP